MKNCKNLYKETFRKEIGIFEPKEPKDYNTFLEAKNFLEDSRINTNMFNSLERDFKVKESDIIVDGKRYIEIVVYFNNESFTCIY